MATGWTDLDEAGRATGAPGSPNASARRWRVLPRPQGLAAQLTIAVGMIAAATLLRLGLGMIAPGIAPFSLYFPAILLAALLGGWRAGAAAAAMSAALAWGLFVEPMPANPRPIWISLFNLALNTGVSAAIVAVASSLGALIERLAQSQGALSERNLYYDTLFQTMFEGFALCEATLFDEGRLTDYVILEMNPALQRMLGVGPEAIGGKLSATPGDQTAWLTVCDRVLKTGKPAVFEFHNRATGRWHEIHISRVTATRMAQLFFDVTERKAAEARQAGLFDELNHRVKNNLGMVSALLNMQARRGDGSMRAELMKAVDRVQSIAEVHESLYSRYHSGEVDFGAYLENLCQRLTKSLLADDRIQIRVEAQSASLGVDHAVPLGMVVNELVTNAVKHAYPAPDGGVVAVSFQRLEGRSVLRIADGGRGLPEDIEGKAGGLGLTLLRSLVQQVGGELTIHGPPGAVFEIRLVDAET